MTDTSRREQQPTVPPRPLRSPRVRGGASSERPWQQSDFLRAYSQLRPTIRMRLTLLYGGMFLIAGVLLLLIIYLLAAQALRNSGAGLRITEGYNLRFASDVCPAVEQAQSGSQFNSILGSCLNHQRAVALDSLLHRSLLALVILAVVAFAFGYAMAGRVLSPLGRITRTARAVAGSDLSRRIELDGPDDELKELADTFDDMLERLERAFTAQQRFVGNASHELRTPLAINRTLLEVHLSDPGAPVELRQLGKTLLATNERSEQLVEGLLLLARSDNQIVERKPVGLAEVSLRADPVPGTRSTPVAFLEAIYVDPPARRHGLARALVTHARAWGRAQGCSEFASDALQDNADSLALHRALGFEETTRIVCFRLRTTG